MARKYGERIPEATEHVLRTRPRTQREKLLSAASAVALEVDSSWDDRQLTLEIRKKSGEVKTIGGDL